MWAQVDTDGDASTITEGEYEGFVKRLTEWIMHLGTVGTQEGEAAAEATPQSVGGGGGRDAGAVNHPSLKM